MIWELGSWRCRREQDWSIADLGRNSSRQVEPERYKKCFPSNVPWHNWRQTKIRWSISSSAPATWSEMSLDRHRTPHQASNEDRNPKRESRDIRSYLQPNTCLNLRAKDPSFNSSLFWDIFSVMFRSPPQNPRKIGCLNIFRYRSKACCSQLSSLNCLDISRF